MPLDPRRPYNDLPRLPPAADVETRVVLKACVTARAALAELDLAGDLLPDANVLITTIPILEARDSSAIEQIVTTNDALFREASLADGDADPPTKEALRYRAALYHGLDAIRERPLSTNVAVEVCRILKGSTLDIRRVPGTTLENRLTGEVIYTPPEGESLLRDLLANWEQYHHGTPDLDPLIKMAVLHYQFEAIHPFVDGNGRTGRILNVLALVEDGLLKHPTLYLSRHIMRTKSEYYRALQGVTEDRAWEPWLVYMLTAVETTSRWTRAKIRGIKQQMDHAASHVRETAPRAYSRELIDLLFVQPYCRIGSLVDKGIAKRQTASIYLRSLLDVGVLTEERRGRDKVYVHRAYLDLLSAEEHDVVVYRPVGKAPL